MTLYKQDLETCIDFKSQLNGLTLEDPVDQLNGKLFSDELETFIRGHPFKGFLYPINFMEGPQADFQVLRKYTQLYF